MTNILRYTILIIALGCSTFLNAEPTIKASFSKNTTCADDLLPLAVILEYSGQSTQNFSLGNSSIFINYNTAKLSINSLDNETIGASNNWDICSYVSETDGSENGFINITLAEPLSGAPSSLIFTSSTSYTINYIHFNIISGQSIMDGDIIFSEYFTSFNQQSPNDGTDQLDVEFSNDLTITNSDDIGCGAVVCDGLFTGSIEPISFGLNGIVTFKAEVTPPGNYTFLWKNGHTTQTNPGQCSHDSNHVDVTDMDTNCTIRFDHFGSRFLSCGRITIGTIDGGITIGTINGGITPVNGTLIPNNGGTLIPLPGPPRLDSDNGNEITIQPNPTKGLFTINFKDLDIDKAVIKMYSVTGKLVKEKGIATSESVVTINASKLSNGMYIVRIITERGDEIYSAKLTIAN